MNENKFSAFSEQSARAVKNVTVWGIVFNILLAIAKFAVGLWAHSQSCVADAVHSFSDLITDLVVLIGVRFWSAPADSDHPHGHQRIEALITLFIGVLLGFTAIKMGIDAVTSIGNMSVHHIDCWPVFSVSLLSMFMKELLYQWTASVGRACHSSAVIGNAWHHRSDALSSIPVAVMSIAAYFWPGISSLDYIAAVIVSCMLFRAAWQIAWPSLKELSDQGIGKTELGDIWRIAASVNGVREVHKIRSRKLGNSIILDMHILVEQNMTVVDGHRICDEVAAEIQRKIPYVVEVLTHLEPANDVKMDDEIARLAYTVDGVREVHGTRVRHVLNGYDVDLHVQVDPDMTVARGHEICRQVRDLLKASKLEITGALIHLEPYNPKK